MIRITSDHKDHHIIINKVSVLCVKYLNHALMKYFPYLSSSKTCSLLLFFLCPVLFAFGQTFKTARSEITVSGIAREKPWSMTADKSEGLMNLIFRDGKLSGVSSLSISINVNELKSKNSKMDQRAYRALKAYPYDKIAFLGKIFTLRDRGDNMYLLNVEGNLNIGGITKIASVPVNIKVNDDGTLTCYGSKEVNMSEFNVAIKDTEARMMRLNDKIQISFELTLNEASP